MPPPNFTRKKRKSRSRGSSAKRASRHINELNSASIQDRSSSVDVAPESSSLKQETDILTCPGTSADVQSVVDSTTRESLISTLADSVATAAIETAESLLKGSPQKRSSHRKALKKSTGTSGIKSNSNCEVLKNVKMVGEDEKLNNLCKLLERLDATYGQNSCQSSPSHNTRSSNSENGVASPAKGLNGVTSPVKEKNDIISSTKGKKEATLSAKGKNDVTSPSKVQKNEKPIANDVSNEANLSQEEKQALRKARKEAKKAGKPVVKSCDSTDSVNINSLSIKTNGEVTPQPLQVTESKPEKSKADLRRERREKQEAQRAAKSATKTENVVDKSESSVNEKPKPEKVVPAGKALIPKKKEVSKSSRHLPLLEHLSTPKADESLSTINSSLIHPAIRATGLSMKDMIIDGCISRVIATLSAIYSLIEDYETPPSCDFSRALADQLIPNISFLNACRPISEPINNAIRFVKREINELESSIPERQAKEELLKAIDTYIHQNIVLASETLTENALEFIEDGDVILTFGYSTLVYETVKAAVKKRDNLSIVMVDNPGVASGVNILQEFVKLGVKVYYRILPDLTHIIKKVTKVIVEAEAVVLNGAVIGNCGMAGLIALASSYSVPVIVLSHTFKFCNIDLTDSLVVNELGDPSVIVDCPSSVYKNYLTDWKATPYLNVVNLVYDVTPPLLINVLVTERSNYPTTVVPVIIKRNYADILGHD